jgi:hypothetical protein
MRATFPANLILNLIALTIFVKCTRYEAPHYAVFSSLLPLPVKHIRNPFWAIGAQFHGEGDRNKNISVVKK